jgi:hypothetical protein
MKIFGREPAVVLQAISATLALAVTFGWSWLSTEQAGAIVALISAVFGVATALLVRPVAPAAFTAVVTAGAALLAAYGLELPAEQVGAVQALVTVLLALVTRVQVTPVASR